MRLKLSLFSLQYPSPQRLRHALRISLGAVAVTIFGLIPSNVSGCLVAIIYFIATIAGTAEPHMGFQLRSADLTLLGGLLAAAAAGIVLGAGGANPVAVFFLTMPFLIVFSSLRADQNLTPMPAVANALTGFFIISRFGTSRMQVIRDTGQSVIEVALGWAVTYAVNVFLFPDRAIVEGRRMLANELRNVGKALSVASSVIITPSPLQRQRDRCCTTPPVTQFPDMPRESAEDICSDRLSEGLNTPVKPFGASIMDNLSTMRRIRVFIRAGCSEPRFSRWLLRRNDWKRWEALLDKCEMLLRKVSALQSVAMQASKQGSKFSRDSIHRFVGDAATRLWTEQYALMAAACQVLSTYADVDQQKHGWLYRAWSWLFGTRSKQNKICAFKLDAELDAREWGRRRQRMYHHVLYKYRQYWREVSGIGNSDTSSTALLHKFVPFCGNRPDAGEVRTTLFALAITHEICETLAHLTTEFQLLSKAHSSLSFSAPFRSFFLACLASGRRMNDVVRFRLAHWEVRFVFTHFLLLWSILALALFTSILPNLGHGEIGWAFSSAALAAQLSAEPTAFIGFLRVTATAVGCGVAIGFTKILHLLGDGSLDYLLLPFMAINTLLVLLFIARRFRYASFLYLVTNVIISLCPRTDGSCVSVIVQDCSPNWLFAAARTLFTTVGVFFAIAFHILFWPRFARTEARHELSTGLYNATKLYSELLDCFLKTGRNGEKSAHDDDVAGFDIKQAQSNPQLYTDIYSGRNELIKVADTRVAKHINAAHSLLEKEASQWKSGPYSTPESLRDFLHHFRKLNISVTEMASTLGRKPVLTGRYSRSVHLLFVDPYVYSYETVRISLQNLTAAIRRAIRYDIDHSFSAEDIVADLLTGISHLKEALRILRTHHAQVRRDAHRILEYHGQQYRGGAECSQELLDQLTSECYMEKSVFRNLVEKCVDLDEDAFARVEADPSLLRSDDMILFFTFTFAGGVCMNAFLCIARSALVEMKEILDTKNKEREKRRKKEEDLDEVEDDGATELAKRLESYLSEDSDLPLGVSFPGIPW